jgi:hypothetical protein
MEDGKTHNNISPKIFTRSGSRRKKKAYIYIILQPKCIFLPVITNQIHDPIRPTERW